MKFPGRVYDGTRIYLAIYNHFPDVHVAVPPSLKGKAKRMAHIAYSEGGKRSGIDIFLLNSPPTVRNGHSPEVPEISFSQPVSSASHNPLVDTMQDIDYELVKDAPDEVVALVRKDISAYCKNPGKTKLSRGIVRVKEIVPVTHLRKIAYSEIGATQPGKPEFVEECLLEANLDFVKGCQSGWIPGEGLAARFDGRIFTGFFLAPSSECGYCYASPKHKTFPKHVFELERQRLKQELLGGARLKYGSPAVYGRPVQVLRLGKRTDAGSKFTLDSLLTTLETCLETGTQTVFPTKLLEFDKTIADLLKRTNSTLLYSIGFDEFEKGAAAHGCTNDWRSEQAVRYRESSVRTALYLLIHPFLAPGKREMDLIDFAMEHDLDVQLLPMRFTSKDFMKTATGLNWDIAVRSRHPVLSPDLAQDYEGTYFVSAGVAVPQEVDPGWLGLIGKNNGGVRMCHHTKKTVWCGSCFIKDGCTGRLTEKPRTHIPKHARNKRSNTGKLF